VGEETVHERPAVAMSPAFLLAMPIRNQKEPWTYSTIAKTRKIEAELNIQELSDRELNR
jgi:hypothetical protein